MVRTPDSKKALRLLGSSDVVVRQAIALATNRGQLEQAVHMTNLLKGFLELTGRGSEGADLMTDLARHVTGSASLIDSGSALRAESPGTAGAHSTKSPPESHGDTKWADSTESRATMNRSDAETLTQVEANLIREAAWARARSSATAAENLTHLLHRLDCVQHWDTRFERAVALNLLGSVHSMFKHHPSQAIARLQAAVDLFAELESTDNSNTTSRAATLGDLANVFEDLGKFDEALAAAKQGLALDRQRNDGSAVARSLGQIAQILQQQGEYTQAEQRYGEVLSAARAAGDDEPEGITWQGLGVMHLNRKRSDEAIPALCHALDAFTRANNTGGQMRVLQLPRKRRQEPWPRRGRAGLV